VSVYGNALIDGLVKIDTNHAELVRALVMCHKPRRVLELGFGAGEATNAMLSGLDYNGQEFDYTVVDSWLDFNGVPPAAIQAPRYQRINFVTSSEKDFVLSCKDSYQFVFSDADHHHTHEWFDVVYERVVSPGGILVYHDVTNTADFPNLLEIYQGAVRNGYNHILLQKSSLPAERCGRGLLVIFKT
jgi:predicted O-methyltransferase YrrM